jgi:hypothetical protein
MGAASCWRRDFKAAAPVFSGEKLRFLQWIMATYSPKISPELMELLSSIRCRKLLETLANLESFVRSAEPPVSRPRRVALASRQRQLAGT